MASAPPAPEPRSTRTNFDRSFDERIDDWSDPYGVAGAAADFLAERLLGPCVTIHAAAEDSDEFVLLARSPRDASRGEAPGTRTTLRAGAALRAMREGSTQQDADVYVEPDFVHSQPGETRSEVAVPVPGAERPVGIVRLTYSGADRPREEQVRQAEVVARRLASVLAGGRTASGPDPVGEVAARLATLLAAGDDVKAAMRTVADGAMAIAGGSGALFLVRHGSRQALEVAAHTGAIPLPESGIVPLEGTLVGEVVRTGQSRSWTRVQGAPGRAVLSTEGDAFSSVIAVPLRSAGRVYGALVVVDRAGGGEHAPLEVERLQRLAHHAAAIDPARQIGPLRRMLSDNSLIAEVGRAVTGTLGLDEVLGLVVRAAEMLVGARGVALGLLTEDGERLNLAATSGALRKSRGQTVPVRGTLIGWAVATASQATSECVSDDPRGFEHEVRQGPGVVVPLESRARIWGALMVTRAEGASPPSDEDTDALRKLAGYASIAIDNAHLYSEQLELSRVLQARTDELSRAYAELRESQERLVVSEKMAALGRITAGIAHEINSPLGGILNSLQLAGGYVEEYRASVGDAEVTADDHAAIAGDLGEAIRMAEAATRKVAEFVRTIKGQTRTGETTARTEFGVAAEVEAVATLLGHELRNRNVEVACEVDPALQLVGDRGKFALVVQNLVSNAIDAYEGEGGVVTVRAERADGALVMTVKDHGCGIPESIRPRIFDYLFTTKDVGKGTGLGLSIVHSIVTTGFHGEISVRSEPGAGSTFTVRFPDVPEPEAAAGRG